ncbi:relaxase/mobilization nuclease domain-containing protein [Enemella dayhoffiae]|uniref:relaxase/mobilization nuclease domain-containing protein n=1 Tax=Enemella dayhoffiae TaxID=2016507 RepID=UPI001E32BB0E|nr:relaxase/mobilization nuclease domain-containing protein [Enemella dayhoffiae]
MIGRRIEARSLIQSFESSEFDPNDPEEVQTVNDLGYEFAKKLHPNSDVLVITHIDGAGGNPHSHITVINHDNVTGRALQGNNMHWHVAKQNDELMRDYGLRVAARGSRNVD